MAFLARVVQRSVRTARPTAVLIFVSFFLFTAPMTVSSQSRSGEKRGSDSPIVELLGTEDQLTSQIRSTNQESLTLLESGDARAADVADTAYRIEQFLRQEGYAAAEVEYRMYRIDDTGSRIEVRTASEWSSVQQIEFRVTAGKKTYFGTFRFQGNEYFSDEELRGLTPRPSALPNQTPIPYQQSRVDSTLRRITEKYTLAGFNDIDIGPVSTSERETERSMLIDVEIPIREGFRYTISTVEVIVEGLPGTIRSQLNSGLGIRGAPYYPRQEIVGESRITAILGDFGYRPEIQTEAKFSDDGTVTVAYSVNTGPQRRLRAINIESQDGDPLRTHTRFISRLAPFSAGDLLSVSEIESFEERLYRLGVFSLVEITETPKTSGTNSTASTPTDLTVALSEGRSRYIEVAAGWGSYELLRGRIGYTDTNLFGRALAWNTVGALSFRTREISTALTDQTLLGPNTQITLDGSYQFRDGPSFDRTEISTGVATYYIPEENVELDTSYRYSYTEADAITAAIEGEEDDALTTGILGGGVSYDTRDSFLIPTEGVRSSLHGQYANSRIGSEIDFWGIDFESAGHVHITDGTYLSARGEFKTRVLISNRTSLPIQERLFLGGNQSVRSFVQDRLGPGNVDGDPIGGLTTVLGSIEIRQRLFGDLFIAGFYDIGSVGRSSWEIDGAYGSGVGVGLRYHLPIGPLRLDGAYNPGDTFTQESRWAIHFAIGFSF